MGVTFKSTNFGQSYTNYVRFPGGDTTPGRQIMDERGRIYVAEELNGGIQVYTPGGEPLGVIGRGDPNSFIEPSELTLPSSVALLGDLLYVIDRGRGVVVFQLPGAAAGRTP